MIRALLFASVCSLALGTHASAADLSSPQGKPSTVFDAFAHVEAGYDSGELSFSATDRKFDFDSGRINGQVSLADTISGPFGYQLDGLFGYTGLSAEHNVFEQDGAFISPAGHIFYRDPEVGSVGLLTQYAFARMYLEANSDGSYVNSHDFYVGPEAQYYFGNATLSGKVAYRYSIFTADETANADGAVASAGLKYFFSNNFDIALSGTFSSMGLDDDGDKVDSNSWVASLKTDYKFENSPFALTANISYGHVSSKYTGIGSPKSSRDNEVRAMVGLTYSLADISLIDRDRSGASFEPVDPIQNGMIFPVY